MIPARESWNVFSFARLVNSDFERSKSWMAQKILLGLCVASVVVSVACSQTQGPASPSAVVNGSAAAGPDGSTLKIAAPALVSPLNNAQFAPGSQVTLTLQNVKGTFATFPVTYEVQVLNGAGAVVANPKFEASNGTTSTVTVASNSLTADAPHSWRARATYGSGVGPWSATGTFRTPIAAFLGGPTGREIFDPLTTGFTVGRQRGGRFLIGQGWQSLTLGDGLDYDLPLTCSNCRLEFDVTNFGKAEGHPFEKDVKWLTMGDASTFDNFGVFRDHDWKMHLEQRADGDGTGMKLIWRNGCGTCGDGEPGDHTGKLGSAVDWRSNQTYHFVFDWTPTNISVSVNGEVWFQDGWSHAYAPPNHRISLGCYPRSETMIGAIWSNVKNTAR
jgi:hypothetical protein